MNFTERRNSKNTALRNQIEALTKIGEQSKALIEEVEKEVISSARNGELNRLPQPLVAKRLTHTFKVQQALLGQAQDLVKGVSPPLLSNEEFKALMDPDT